MSDNRIIEENKKTGTQEWQLQFHRFDNPITRTSYPLIRRLRSSEIEGFASKPSVQPGDSIDFMISLEPAGRFTIDIYRMGYYGGAGGRHMVRLGPFEQATQPVPMMTMERLRECTWEPCTTFSIPSDWPSGVYLGKLTRQEPFGSQSYIIFVVREHRATDLLCQVSDLTWQAYNKWPGDDSLYDDGTPNVYYTGPNVRVSFDRPYAKYSQYMEAPQSVGSGEYLLWEFPLTFWLEKQGYDVTYCSNVDLHLHPQMLASAKAFLSVGHDEYWSEEMFANLSNARDDGLSVAFFSGNAIYYQTQFYRSLSKDQECRGFSREGHYQDEDSLLGVKSSDVGYGDWTITTPQHWIFENTGAQTGDNIPGIVGFEFHGTPAKIPGLEVVASSPLSPCIHERLTPDPINETPIHHAVVYPGPKGNWVFNAGTIWWPEGLSSPPGHISARTQCGGSLGVNPLAQNVTANVLDRMIADAPQRR